MELECEIEKNGRELEVEVDMQGRNYQIGTDVYVNGQKVDKFNADTKQDKLSKEQLDNIANVPNKQDKLTDTQINNINNIPNKQDKLTDKQLADIDDIPNKANQSDLTAEISAREQADINTLASANSFTTGQIKALNEQLKKYGVTLNIVTDGTLYKYTFQLKNNESKVISEQTIDLPLESVVVNGSYDNITKKVILTLQNGSTIEFPIGDIVNGLVSETTFNAEVKKINDELTNIDGIVAENNAEINTLKQTKQDKLSTNQLDNINAVPSKQDKLSQSQLDNINAVPNKLDKVAIKNAHDDSTENVYSTAQTNNEIIDSFRYNFRQKFNPTIYKNLVRSGITETFDGQGSFTLVGTATAEMDFSLLHTTINIFSTHKYFFNDNNKNKDALGRSTSLLFENNSKIYSPKIFIGHTQIKESRFYCNKGYAVNVDASPILIDLTEMFGAGNEPTTVEEVQQYLVPNKYYPYGKNIEPNMYAVKAEVNSLSMTIDYNNVITNLFPTAEGQYDYTAPDNGWIVINVLYADQYARSVQVYDGVLGYLRLPNVEFRSSIIMPISKGHTFKITIDSSFAKIKTLNSAFYYTKEID